MAPSGAGSSARPQPAGGAPHEGKGGGASPYSLDTLTALAPNLCPSLPQPSVSRRGRTFHWIWPLHFTDKDTEAQG